MPAFKSHSTATVDTSWDGPAMKTRVRSGETAAYYGKIYAWRDPAADEGNKSSYKFIHHEVDANGDPGAANTVACSAGIAVLNGGRGGTTIPDADRQGVYDHLAKHLADAGKEAPPLKNQFRGFAIRPVNAVKEAEIWIYEEIGAAGWFGGGMSAKQFADDLNALGSLDTITVRINSPGGDVFDGLAIFNVLKQNKARVIVNIDGLAASIASIIAMAGDEIHMAENALMMIHEAWTMSMGNAADMRATADRLDLVNGSLVGTYARKTGMQENQIAGMMAAETWMTANEAQRLGFADSVGDPMQMAAHFDLKKYQFKNPPQINADADGLDNPSPSGADAPAGADAPDLSIFDTGISRCEAILNKE